MLQIQKNYINNEHQKMIAVQVPVADFNKMEEVIENYGLAKLMDDAKLEKALSLKEAQQVYEKLRKNRE